MPGALLWAWDTDNNEWVKVKTDDQGRLYTVATIDELDDIGDVYVPTPTDGYILYWNDGNSRWECKAAPIAAHKDTHDPIDGSDKLDTAAPVKIGEANAIGSSHSFPRADHVHEKHHAKYLDNEAKAAAVQAGAITDAVTKAPTHDAVYDVKVTADAAQTSAEVDAKITTHKNIAAAHHAKTVDASELTAGELPLARLKASIKTASITFIIGVVGTVITTGIKGDLEIPFACTINRVTLLANKSGSIVIDIWKQAYADYPPEDAQSITSSAPPTITTAEKSQDSTLTGWTIAIAAGDCLRFNVDSITTIEQVTLSLKVTKT